VMNTTPTVVYKDVGNRIDCTVVPQADGRFRLSFFVDQSSVDSSLRNRSAPGRPDNPIMRSFMSEFTMFLRDGQTAQSTSATDPVSGEVLRVDVTLNVVK
jgi:hypothetical protein